MNRYDECLCLGESRECCVAGFFIRSGGYGKMGAKFPSVDDGFLSRNIKIHNLSLCR